MLRVHLCCVEILLTTQVVSNFPTYQTLFLSQGNNTLRRTRESNPHRFYPEHLSRMPLRTNISLFSISQSLRESNPHSNIRSIKCYSLHQETILRLRTPLCCLVSIKTPAPSLPNRIPLSREQHGFEVENSSVSQRTYTLIFSTPSSHNGLRTVSGTTHFKFSIHTRCQFYGSSTADVPKSDLPNTDSNPREYYFH